MALLKEILTNSSRISKIDDDIIRIEFKPNHLITEEDFEENYKAYFKLMDREKFFLLSIANEGSSVAPEVRKKFSTPERSSFKLAEAFVIRTLAHRLVAGFVTKIQPPSHNLKFFENEREALKWLRQQVVNYKSDHPQK